MAWPLDLANGCPWMQGCFLLGISGVFTVGSVYFFLLRSVLKEAMRGDFHDIYFCVLWVAQKQVRYFAALERNFCCLAAMSE